MQIIGQRDVEPATASLIMSLESVFAVLCGVLFLHETMTRWEITGCILLFIAVILSQIRIPSKKGSIINVGVRLIEPDPTVINNS
jgi:drug/metabolite transporter (DMT)-like permease